MKIILFMFFVTLFAMASCAEDDNATSQNEIVMAQEEGAATEEGLTESENEGVKVVSVTFFGEENDYSFSVGISSPDTGCDQYADWWEVITEDGILLYRRILTHSHVNEQPFIRSGGIVNITSNQIVIIRAHMNNTGYGTYVYKGSVNSGFNESTIESSFANNLLAEQPLPNDCEF